MSVLATMVLVERYGLRLNVDQLAEVLDVQPGTVRNQITARKSRSGAGFRAAVALRIALRTG